MDHRVLSLEIAEQNSAIEKISRIVGHSNRSRCKEYRIFVVADLERVDRDAVEKAAAHLADVNFPLDLSREHRHHHSAHALLAEAGVGHADDAQDDYHPKPHQHDGARENDAETACHGKLERLADREAERELAAEAIVLRRLIRP